METLLSSWSRLVHSHPDRVVVQEASSGQSFTVRDIESASRERSKVLLSRGLGGRAIVFVEQNGASWLSAFLGILQAGGVAVPLEPDQCPRDSHGVEAMRCNAILEGDKLRVFSTLSFGLPDDLCLGKATSGSTGLPKLMFFRDSEMLADGRNVLSTMGLREDDRQYAAIPLGHSYGLGNLVLPLILKGIPLVAASGVFPQVMLADMYRYQVSVFPAVPALLRALTRVGEASELLSALRLVISAGAPLESAIRVAFKSRFGLPIHNFYGSSETGGLCYDRTGEGTTEAGTTVGTPLKGVVLQQYPDGSLGVRSEAIYRFENPQASAPWFALPDTGSFDARGNLFLTGRQRSFLKVGARRLDPREIEELALQLPGTGFVWASTYSSSQGDRIGLVYEGTMAPVNLKAALDASLPAWKRPSRFRQIKTVPRTVRGKVSAQALQEILDSREGR